MSATAPTRSTLDDLLRPVARYWWLWALFGVLSIVAGVIALAVPDLSLLTIAILFGTWLVVVGFFDVLGGLTADDLDTSRRIFTVLLGIISLIAGVICLRLPDAGLLAIVIVTGSYLIVAGALNIAAAIGNERPWLSVALGVADLILGVLILALPSLSLVTLAVFFGIGLIIRGAVAVATAVQLRRLRPADARSRPAASSVRPVGS